jgi:predicted alpha/beta hydrolase family esterase
MKTYMVYGSRKEHFYQRVEAKNKAEAKKIAETNEWESSDYDDEYINIDEIEVEA